MGSLWAATQLTLMLTSTAILKDMTIDDTALVLHVQRDTTVEAEVQRQGTALPTTVTVETLGMASKEIVMVMRSRALVILHDTTVSDRKPPPTTSTTTTVLRLIDELDMHNADDPDLVVVAYHQFLADHPGVGPIVVVPAVIFMDDVYDRGLARAPPRTSSISPDNLHVAQGETVLPASRVKIH
jgi:hypothetical protein